MTSPIRIRTIKLTGIGKLLRKARDGTILPAIKVAESDLLRESGLIIRKMQCNEKPPSKSALQRKVRKKDESEPKPKSIDVAKVKQDLAAYMAVLASSKFKACLPSPEKNG